MHIRLQIGVCLTDWLTAEDIVYFQLAKAVCTRSHTLFSICKKQNAVLALSDSMEALAAKCAEGFKLKVLMMVYCLISNNKTSFAVWFWHCKGIFFPKVKGNMGQCFHVQPLLQTLKQNELSLSEQQFIMFICLWLSSQRTRSTDVLCEGDLSTNNVTYVDFLV